MKMATTARTGIARSKKENAIRELDALLDFAKRSRVVTFRLDGNIGRTMVVVPQYYGDIRPQPTRVEYAKPLDEADLKSQADLAHWTNQNVLIRLCAVLDAHRLLKLLRRENAYVKLAYALRNAFAHDSG